MSKNKIEVIDIVVCQEFDISINELCAIIEIYHDDDNLNFDDTGVDYKKLQDKKFIKIITDSRGDHYLLRQKANNLIDTLIGSNAKQKATKSSKKQMNVDIITRIPEFRSKWKGLKPGSMGSLQSCKDKLTRWMNENPDYEFDDVLAAADAYIESLGGDYRFLQRADYFIYKQENNREESSRLSAFIDEIGGVSQGDWTSQLN